LRMEETVCRHRWSAEESEKYAMTLCTIQVLAKLVCGTASQTPSQLLEKVIVMILKHAL